MHLRRLSILSALAAMALAAGCHHNKVQNPIANINSKQPDKVLFDRAMEAMKRNRFEVARITLQTLINTYPDSEYIARAKLAVGDSWYAEGGTAALTQAENEYKDFITFFPNMPEAAEAQLKVAGIHYQQMEKPDRDFTHAKLAEEEYRQLMLQFPDSKLVPEAKQRLLEVQQVLAEREFRVGRFYFLRESWGAAIARLKSLVDNYPLYSQADEALYMLGQTYERQAELLRAAKMLETAKANIIQELENKAAEAYGRLLTRYPVMGRASDAKSRLKAMGRPVPSASDAMIAQNKAEEASRGATGTVGRIMMNFRKRPDVAQAAKVGEPTLNEAPETSAPEVNKQLNQTILNAATGALAVEMVGKGAPPPNQATPRSQPAAGTTAAPELRSDQPNSAGTSETKTATASDAPQEAPKQVNEAQSGTEAQASSEGKATEGAAGSKQESTSRKKKKKGLRKIIPF